MQDCNTQSTPQVSNLTGRRRLRLKISDAVAHAEVAESSMRVAATLSLLDRSADSAIRTQGPSETQRHAIPGKPLQENPCDSLKRREH